MCGKVDTVDFPDNIGIKFIMLFQFFDRAFRTVGSRVEL